MSKENRIVKKIRKLDIKLIKAKAPFDVFNWNSGTYHTVEGNPVKVAIIEKKLQHLREDLEEARKPRVSMWDDF
jgi:hypothetical protein